VLINTAASLICSTNSLRGGKFHHFLSQKIQRRSPTLTHLFDNERKKKGEGQFVQQQ
jgi:hypothetical protein